MACHTDDTKMHNGLPGELFDAGSLKDGHRRRDLNDQHVLSLVDGAWIGNGRAARAGPCFWQALGAGLFWKRIDTTSQLYRYHRNLSPKHRLPGIRAISTATTYTSPPGIPFPRPGSDLRSTIYTARPRRR